MENEDQEKVPNLFYNLRKIKAELRGDLTPETHIKENYVNMGENKSQHFMSYKKRELFSDKKTFRNTLETNRDFETSERKDQKLSKRQGENTQRVTKSQ